jgi:hypothetical protein
MKCQEKTLFANYYENTLILLSCTIREFIHPISPLNKPVGGGEGGGYLLRTFLISG